MKVTSIIKTFQKIKRTLDDLKYKDDLKYEDKPNNEDYLKYEDDLKNRVFKKMQE